MKQFDAEFHAFGLLSGFLRERATVTTGIDDLRLMHSWAARIAKELTSGDFVYFPRHDADGNYIPPEKRKRSR